MFDLPPKCPALANKLTGIFGWRHTYKVSAKHEGIQHSYLQKSYSLTLPTKRPPSPYGYIKDPDAWVSVHHLQTQCGILDPDDCVRDVADDREYIHASFEDSGPDPGVPQGGGDGASGSSSVGTGSPDIFRDPTNTDAPTNGGHIDNSTPHIEVTSTTSCPMTGLGLQVRRSSDPNILASLKAAENGNKRWSAAAPHCGGDSPERILMEKSGYLPPQWEEEDDGHHQAQQMPQQQPFARSGRLSMQFLGDGTGYKWIEAAEKLQQNSHHHPQQTPQHQQHSQSPQAQTNFFTSKSLPRESTRKEPLGQAYESIREKDGEMLLLINEYGSPLGLTAIPDNEHGGGLLVQHVEPGSRAERGRLRKGDRILEINGTKLIGLTELKVQEYLRKALEASELRVRVIRGNASSKEAKYRRRDSKVAEMIEAEEKMATGLESKVATVSPTRKPNTAPVGASLQVANTRKLGRKIEIILKKGQNGLGFTITTRDNPAGGHCPIYIKNILPRGAAIEDGRLRPGDRLLEVDGILMTGKTQTDVVSILRATQPGATVRLMVSRQHDLAEPEEREINFENKENEFDSPPKPPAPVLPASMQTPQHEVKKSQSARSLFEQHQQQQHHNLNESQHFIDAGSESAASSDSLQAGVAWRSREMLTFHIPVHDTEKAGLGVSVKGKTSSNLTGSSNGSSNGSMKNDGDLGIFVKSVIHGGAASRDGRLRMNDQLVSINGVSLLGQSNAEAMDTLKRAIVNNPGKHPGMITLQVARKITRSSSSGDILEHTNESSSTSENSGATVIYLSPEKRNSDINRHNNGASATNDMNRWSNPVLDRLTGGACSGNSTQKSRSNAAGPSAVTVLSSSGKTPGGGGGANSGVHALRNESYYMATNDTWSPAMHHTQKHVNNSVLIEHDPEPISPTLPHRPNESLASTITNNTSGSNATPQPGGGPQNFDATYSSQLSLETNSGVEHFSRDALGRRSISEKHHAALDARETGTYQRNKKLREERERRVAQTKSAVYGSMESLTARIAEANARIPGYKHAKTNSGIEQQHMQAESRDQVGDLGPSLGLKKSSSLESLQTMVQEIQMSDEPRGGPTTLRAPRGRGREESLRAAVSSDHDVKKARQTWLLEDGDPSEGGFNQRNGPCQSSLNDGKQKSRAKKPGILRGIGYMFRFGKNRKDGVAPVENHPPVTNNAANERTPANNQIPSAALAAMERNAKLAPPAYQPPPPLPPANANGTGGAHSDAMAAAMAAGIHQNDIFNHRYQHYSNYEELHNHHQQISDDNCSNSDVLSESTLECMRQQVLWQRLKVEAESRRHQHYHSQRSARSQDINMQQYAHSNHNHNHPMNHHASNNGKTPSLRSSNPNYYDYETAQHNLSQTSTANGNTSLNGSFQHRTGSIKQHKNGHITVNAAQQQHSQHSPAPSNGTQAQAHWKTAAMNGFSPASLNSSARSRGPFVTHVTLGPSSNSNNIAAGQQQPTYQTVQKHHHNLQHQQQQQQQHGHSSQYASVGGGMAGPQQHTTATASKV